MHKNDACLMPIGTTIQGLMVWFAHLFFHQHGVACSQKENKRVGDRDPLQS